ncbi:hypothetical protein CESP606_18585 [Cereibacter sphaeroides]
MDQRRSRLHRLERRMAAARRECAADEGRAAEPVPEPHLAQRVRDIDRRVGRVSARAEAGVDPFSPGQGQNLGAALRMTGRDHQKVEEVAGAAEGLQHRGLLALVGRGREQAACPRRRGKGGRRGQGGAHARLQEEPRAETLRRKARRDEAPLGGRVLRREPADRAEHLPQEPGRNPSPAPRRAFRQARADGEHRDAAGGASGEPLGPELVLEEKEGPRPPVGEEAVDSARAVPGREAGVGAGQAPASDHRPRRGIVAGDDQACGRIARQQFLEQPARGGDLAVARAMQPDRAACTRIQSQPLPQLVRDAPAAQAAEEDAQNEAGQQEAEKEAVERHAGPSLGSRDLSPGTALRASLVAAELAD